MIRRALLVSLLLLPLAATAPAQAPAPSPTPEAQAATLLPHQANYRLSLDTGRPPGAVVQAQGSLVFEILDACDAWAARQRFSLIVEDAQGNLIETGSEYTTLEAKDGSRLRFSLVQTTEGAVTARVAGTAELTPEGGVIRYTEPAPAEVALPPGTLLPSAHTLRALAAARAGQRVLVAPLFDGTSEEGPTDTTTIIVSGWLPPEPHPRFSALSGLSSARMRVAFFDRPEGEQPSAATPSYEVGLRYFENGVGDELLMDFGEFAVRGQLTEFRPVPSPC